MGFKRIWPLQTKDRPKALTDYEAVTVAEGATEATQQAGTAPEQRAVPLASPGSMVPSHEPLPPQEPLGHEEPELQRATGSGEPSYAEIAEQAAAAAAAATAAAVAEASAADRSGAEAREDASE